MGSNCARLFAVFYEIYFFVSLAHNYRPNFIEVIISTAINIDNPYFEQMVGRPEIPTEIHLKRQIPESLFWT